MADPATALTSGGCAGAALALPCTFFGAAPDAALIGLVAATLVTFWLDGLDSRWKSFFAVLTSSLVAAYGAAHLANLIASWTPAPNDADALRMLCAVVIGLAGPTAIPKLIKRAGQRAEEV